MRTPKYAASVSTGYNSRPTIEDTETGQAVCEIMSGGNAEQIAFDIAQALNAYTDLVRALKTARRRIAREHRELAAKSKGTPWARRQLVKHLIADDETLAQIDGVLKLTKRGKLKTWQ
jgi:hypothetical protein